MSTESNPPEAEAITEDIFQHLVKLAAFELEPQEQQYLRRELNGQLRAIRELEAIDVDDDLPISSHGVPYQQEGRLPLREDEIQPSQWADDILHQAPEVEGRYIVVPDIPHEELE